jgi:hypothetical protein
VPYDPEREHASASFRAKQLIVLATDAVLELLRGLEHAPIAVAGRLVEARVLPACYRRRYDRTFLVSFHNVLEQTRNALVSDLPFLGTTAGELAAHGIFTESERILSAGGTGREDEATAVHPSLARQLAVNTRHLVEEIDLLEAATIEDSDVLALFDVPANQEPDEHLTALKGPTAWALLRFENWLVPFGSAPRPFITYDGRAWPAQF